VFHRIS
jgi:hypothetical protein